MWEVYLQIFLCKSENTLIFLYYNITFKSPMSSLFEDKLSGLFKCGFLNSKCDLLKLICNNTCQQNIMLLVISLNLMHFPYILQKLSK